MKDDLKIVGRSKWPKIDHVWTALKFTTLTRFQSIKIEILKNSNCVLYPPDRTDTSNQQLRRWMLNAAIRIQRREKWP